MTLFQVVLSLFVRGSSQAADLLMSGRFLMVEIFWLNLFLIALSTGEKLTSLKGLAALLGAATLAPLWDYGFEIRHDNLLLTGLLLMWCLIRIRPIGFQSFLLLGALTVSLEFVAFKAFVYTIPLSLGVLIAPPPRSLASRRKSILAWTIGACAMLALIRITFGMMGWWELYLAGSEFLAATSSVGHRFGPEMTLGRLLWQTPLLLALTIAALFGVIDDLRQRGKAAANWNGGLPEALLFMLALGVLIVNPAPFPYNLLFLVPFAYLVVFRYFAAGLSAITKPRLLFPLAGSIVLFTHVIPFGIATRRHLQMTNLRQEHLMELAEGMTDPAKDSIYDGAWMVVSRPTDPRWVIHSFNIQSLVSGDGPHVRDLLAEQPPAIFIPNYRTDWLPEADHDYIRQHYVPLGDDFWVLGTKLPRSGGSFKIIHPGRYQISQLKQSNILGTYPDTLAEAIKAAGTKKEEPPFVGTLDGMAVSNRPVELTVGTHRVESAGDDEVAVVWVGPHLDKAPQVGRGDHLRLFVNWY